MSLKTYRDLDAWQKAMDLVVAVYKLTKQFPATEKYGLTSQIQRAAVSVPANIAEGYWRTHRGEYLHHLSVGRGSLAEVETHVTIAVRLEIIPRERGVEVWELCQAVGKTLNRLIQSLERRPPEPGTLNPEPERGDS